MDTIRFDGNELEVEEIARDPRHPCRVVKVVGQETLLFQFVVSTGPYKIDLPHVCLFTTDQLLAYQSGELSLGELALELERKVWSET